jgi:type II secretory pathway pseudopilin PulG
MTRCGGSIARHGGVALILVLVLILVLASLGFFLSVQSSQAQAETERLDLNFQVDLAADSALEEASTKLAQGLPDLPPVGSDGTRADIECDNLQECLPWPAAIDPVLARAHLGPKAEIGPVLVQMSPWVTQRFLGRDDSGNPVVTIREVGVVQFQVDVTCRLRDRRIARRVKVRQFVGANPLPDSPLVRIRVQPSVISREVVDL